jgi:hypothetical protein
VNLVGKLQAKPGQRLRFVNVPAAIARELVRDGVVEAKTGEPCDGVLAFCETPADVAAVVADVMRTIPKSGLIWFAYRKGAAGKKAGLTRDIGWQPVKALGLDGVRAIAFDDDWSGTRFRPS